MDDTTIKLVLALAAAFSLVVGALVWLVKFSAKAIVSFIAEQLTSMQTAITTHTKDDLEHHADVKSAIVRVESKLDAAADDRARARRRKVARR